LEKNNVKLKYVLDSTNKNHFVQIEQNTKITHSMRI